MTFEASGALNRICTRELLSTCQYCASRTFELAGLKSLEFRANDKLAANRAPTPITFTAFLRGRHANADLKPDRAVLSGTGIVTYPDIGNKAIYLA